MSGEEKTKAQRDHEDARRWRRMDALLEDPRGIEGVFWEALREEKAGIDLTGKQMQAVEEALAKAVRWAMNTDGASDDVEVDESGLE